MPDGNSASVLDHSSHSKKELVHFWFNVRFSMGLTLKMNREKAEMLLVIIICRSLSVLAAGNHRLDSSRQLVGPFPTRAERCM